MYLVSCLANRPAGTAHQNTRAQCTSGVWFSLAQSKLNYSPITDTWGTELGLTWHRISIYCGSDIERHLNGTLPIMLIFRQKQPLIVQQDHQERRRQPPAKVTSWYVGNVANITCASQHHCTDGEGLSNALAGLALGMHGKCDGVRSIDMCRAEQRQQKQWIGLRSKDLLRPHRDVLCSQLLCTN